MAKPQIAIVGPGNLGTALAVSLRNAGYSIETVIAHSRGESLRKAQRLARRVDGHARVDMAGAKAQLIWLCVPDAEIARAAQALAEIAPWKGRVVLHSSGALTSDELRPLQRRGAAVGSLHPLMTFVRGSLPSFAGLPFAIEGDTAAVRIARQIVRDLGGQANSIRRKDKAAYHAWGTFASPLLTALLATMERIAEIAGVNRTVARRRMMPILRQTLANYNALGAPDSFSGPIIRGDIETIRRHLRVLKSVPAAREVYSSLARAALQYLPAKNKTALKRVLNSHSR